MTRRFAIKKEIRSLGIDLCNSERVIGAVVRGGLYLDGVVFFSPKLKRWNPSIANEVVGTRYYPELKLIMTHDREQRLDVRKIERITKLPVIEIRSKIQRTIVEGFCAVRIGRKESLARSSLGTRTVEEVLKRTWTKGSLPEPLRVAHLIAKSRFLGKKPPILG